MGGQGARPLGPSTFGVTVVLDSHGLTSLANNRARLEELRRRGEWPAIVPSVILTEALTGDHRRDHRENRLLRACDIKPVDELLARSAARLRAAARARRAPSAVDAIVVAVADEAGGGVVLSSDPGDLRALAHHTTNRVTIARA
jgi:predicted nucleic acid-binding protein